MSVLEAIPHTSLTGTVVGTLPLLPPIETPIDWSTPVDYSTVYMPTPSTTDPTQFKGNSAGSFWFDEINKINEINATFDKINTAIAAANEAMKSANVAYETAMAALNGLPYGHIAVEAESDTIPQSWIDAGHDVIDKARAIELLTEVAASVPDGHSDSRALSDMPAVYFIGEMGSCIIGRIFERLGYTVDDLVMHSHADGKVLYTDKEVNSGSIRSAYPANMRLTPAARSLLYRAQGDNDRGAPWNRIAEQVQP